MTIHIKSFKCTTVSNCLDRILVWQVGLWVQALVWRPDRDQISGQHNHILPAPPDKVLWGQAAEGLLHANPDSQGSAVQDKQNQPAPAQADQNGYHDTATGSSDRQDTGLMNQHNSPDWNCPTSLQPRAEAELSQYSKGLKDLNLEATCMKRQQLSFSSLISDQVHLFLYPKHPAIHSNLHFTSMLP